VIIHPKALKALIAERTITILLIVGVAILVFELGVILGR
jgi:hypothetical protein